MSTLTFLRSNGGRFEISSYVVDSLSAHIQNASRAKEAGGVLLGRYILDTEDIVVDLITSPMKGDRRRRTSFKRGRLKHQWHIIKTWAKSAGTCNYLGEWHTHPEPNPGPSKVDLKDWSRRLASDNFATDSLFFVLVGIIYINVWEVNKTSGKIEPLPLREGF